MTRGPLPPPRSMCPLARALDLLGDKWTLLVIRDLLFGKRRYGQIASSPEGIPSNLLADRLSRLHDAGLVRRVPYQDRPPRFDYELTDAGSDLRPAMMAIIQWAQLHLPDVANGPPPSQGADSPANDRK